MDKLRSSARVVVIGGGIGGASAAYHLAALGVSDVLLLERGALSSGTTWHSTGNMETYRANPLIFEMVRYAAELYPQAARESGLDIGWRVVGRVMYTDRDERWTLMRTLPELGRVRGIDIELLRPAQIRSRLPIIAEDDLIGGIWVPSDARVNPTDAVAALARLARARGVEIRERCQVLRITVRGGAVRGLVTGDGAIDCDTVVLAAGLWSSELAKSCGLQLPLYALEHQYLITKPLGIERNLPLFLSYDDQLYGREEVGGIVVGSLDDRAIAVSTAELPQDFSSCLLNERWDQFEPYMATAMRRFPILRTAPVKMLLNGPESFTPDGQMLLGPVPGVTGLYAACGFNSNGMALAPAAGLYIAEWIVEGVPSADVAALDVRRFSLAQSAEAYLRERVSEVPGYHCRLRAIDEDYRSARNVRRSPLHDQLAAAGARFASVSAWERALWFDQGRRHASWLEAVTKETAAGVERALVVDHSADAKYLLAGVGATDWLAAVAPALPICNAKEVTWVPLPGAQGQVEVLARVCARHPERCLLIASPDQESRLREWLRRAELPPRIRVIEQTAGCACLELRGPARAPLIDSLARTGYSIEAFEDVANGSSVLLFSSEIAGLVLRRLTEQGAGSSGCALGGHLADEALRILRGVPAFGREVGPATLIDEIDFDGNLSAPTQSRSRVPRTHRARAFAAFSSPMDLSGFGAHDVILADGRPVGEITSRVRLFDWPAALVLGLLGCAQWPGGAVVAVADGKVWPLLARRTSWQEALRR